MLGSTHFLEHLLFKGTSRRSSLEIAEAFDRVGGESNAGTAKESTVYHARVLDEDLPMAVEVLTDMLTSSLIDPDELETERGVILEELAMNDDDPSDVVHERFASRLFDTDATLWGPGAEPEASKRLGWLGLPRSSRPLVGELAALRDELTDRGVDRVVLCGMGGSSLAPEVICATAGVPLVVLDSSHPDVVRAAATELERTVVVVSSKSGSTVETDSQRRAARAVFEAAGIDPAQRVVVVGKRRERGRQARCVIAGAAGAVGLACTCE